MTESEDEINFDLLGDMKKKIRALPKSNNNVKLQAQHDEHDDEYNLDELLSGTSKNSKKSTRLGKGASRKNNKKLVETIVDTVPEPTVVEIINDVPPPPLSPLSMLLLEEEKRKAKERDDLPVSRRLRSSVGRRKVTPPPVVDHIDLVSEEPVHVVEGIVSLDSDEDEAKLVNVSFDADNPEISVKIRWKGNCEKYLLRKYQKFERIMQQIADRENVPIEDIVLNLNDKIIEANDTPDTIGYKIYHFIDGRVMKVQEIFKEEPASTLVSNSYKSKTKSFHLKVQSNKSKHPLYMTIKKTDTFKILYIKCAEEFKVELSQIRLLLDGEQILPSETPDTMGLDSGDVVDLKIK